MRKIAAAVTAVTAGLLGGMAVQAALFTALFKADLAGSLDRFTWGLPALLVGFVLFGTWVGVTIRDGIHRRFAGPLPSPHRAGLRRRAMAWLAGSAAGLGPVGALWVLRKTGFGPRIDGLAETLTPMLLAWILLSPTIGALVARGVMRGGAAAGGEGMPASRSDSDGGAGRTAPLGVPADGESDGSAASPREESPRKVDEESPRDLVTA